MKLDVRLPYKHDYLLVLRGLLAFFVVLHHYEYDDFLKALTGLDAFKYLAPDGSYLVYGFFVLSGYLMAKILNTRYTDRYGVARYFYNRLVRILPVFYFSVAFTVILAPSLGKLPRLLPLLSFYANYWGNPAENPALWSICTEVQFYLLAPLLGYFLNRMRLVKFRHFVYVYLGGVIFNLLARRFWDYNFPGQWVVYMGLESNLIFFLTGWIAYLAKDRLPKFHPLAAGAAVMVLVILCWIWDANYRRCDLYGSYGNPVWIYVLPVVMSLCLLVLIPSLDRPVIPYAGFGWFFEGLVFLGLVSYSTYVVHFPFLKLNFGVLDRLPSQLTHLALLLVFCCGIHLFIEKPFMKLKLASLFSKKNGRDAPTGGHRA